MAMVFIVYTPCVSASSGVLSESPRRWPVVLGVLLVGSLLVVRLAGVRVGFLQVPVVQA